MKVKLAFYVEGEQLRVTVVEPPIPGEATSATYWYTRTGATRMLAVLRQLPVGEIVFPLWLFADRDEAPMQPVLMSQALRDIVVRRGEAWLGS